MKTIEQAQNEHMLYKDGDGFSFRAGAEFAQQWILIEEEFPDFEKWIILKNDNTYAAARIHGDVDVKFIKMNFTHWRPIELK
jgi:hypothetical protein